MGKATDSETWIRNGVEWRALPDQFPHVGPERRLTRLLVSPELVVHLAVGVLVEVLSNPVPGDAKVVGVTYDPARHDFVVFLEHQSFEPVPDGDSIPLLYGPTYRRLQNHSSTEP